MDIDAYDTLVASIYAAGIAGEPLPPMFQNMRDALAAAAAGLLIYGEDERIISHTLVRSARKVTRSFLDGVAPLNEEPGARLLLSTPLPEPRRFTDIMPETRMRQSSWYRRQAALTGMGYGLAVDMAIAGIRIRLFAVRAVGAANFDKDDIETIGRLARHLERAFANDVARFSPFRRAPGLQIIVNHEDRLAAPFVRTEVLDRKIGARFGLTLAEARVFRIMADGPTRGDAAARLGIGLNSLKTHMRRIYAKTGTSRLPDLIFLMRSLRDEAERSSSPGDAAKR